MNVFIKTTDLTPGTVLIQTGYSSNRDYLVLKVQKEKVEVQCPSGAIRHLNEKEITEMFASTWNLGAKNYE